MHLTGVRVENFRLLKNVELGIEESVTVILGRNNSGKTSLSEIFRRILDGGQAFFRLEDFSFACHQEFKNAYCAFQESSDEVSARSTLPTIALTLTIQYDANSVDLSSLSSCIIDLDPDCNRVQVRAAFGPREGHISELLSPLVDTPEPTTAQILTLLSERITDHYEMRYFAVDPTDPDNIKRLTSAEFRAVIQADFISAQRGLDDVTQKERDVIGQVLEVLFEAAASSNAPEGQPQLAERITEAVQEIQDRLGKDFQERLDGLLPAFTAAGYPGLNDSAMRTETKLDVSRLLSHHTRIRYLGVNGVTLPESYNGLGTRNLILILLRLYGFYRRAVSSDNPPAVHLIFLEEPEAHLHPQMQEVFIRQLQSLPALFLGESHAATAWPVQFVVSSHSSHLANRAAFEWMRYFLAEAVGDREFDGGARQAVVKDLRLGLGGTPEEDRAFLHQYLTLTGCDLLFADKAILIEGTSERLLLPAMIKKVDEDQPETRGLASQYLSILEVGGAYAHKFLGLIAFLGIRTLILTDIDAVSGKPASKCVVSEGEGTSNACIRQWFGGSPSPVELLAKSAEEKVRGHIRLAYQIPDHEGGACGRTLEDAFVLANSPGTSSDRKRVEEAARDRVAGRKKTEFALNYALEDQAWSVPRYIHEGLVWLGKPESAVPPVLDLAVTDAAAEVISIVDAKAEHHEP